MGVNSSHRHLQYLVHKPLQVNFESHGCGLSINTYRSSELVSTVWARCSLSPVGSRKLPFYMQYRSLQIGAGPGSQMNLRLFSFCHIYFNYWVSLCIFLFSSHYFALFSLFSIFIKLLCLVFFSKISGSAAGYTYCRQRISCLWGIKFELLGQSDLLNCKINFTSPFGTPATYNGHSYFGAKN
jgi:hypothetical protein